MISEGFWVEYDPLKKRNTKISWCFLSSNLIFLLLLFWLMSHRLCVVLKSECFAQKNALSPFLFNLSMCGEMSNVAFSYFHCSFVDVAFDNVSKDALYFLLRDGRAISSLIEFWLDSNTDLVLSSNTNASNDFTRLFFDGFQKYQQKTFSRSPANFRPSHQIGSGRSLNVLIKGQSEIDASRITEAYQLAFEEYCDTQVFIFVSQRDFPLVHFRVVSGSSLRVLFPKGVIAPDLHDEFFFPLPFTPLLLPGE